MAENKKGFVLYCDLIHTIKKMPPGKAGELFLHILSYVNDENPTTDDLVIELTFEPIKQQLKRDLVKYEALRTKNKRSADIRWNANASERIPPHTKNADKDKDTVKVTVTDKVIVKDKEIKTKEFLRDNISLHRKEIEMLQTQYTDEEINWMYDKLSAYKLSKGKNYKSDYGAINSWVTDRLKEEKEKNSAKKENNGKSKSEKTIAGAYEVLTNLGINPNDHFPKTE